MKVKSESEVTQLCQTRSDPIICSPPGSSVHGIFQARVLEWGAIASSIFVLPNCQQFQYHLVRIHVLALDLIVEENFSTFNY